jgi:Peptidase family M28
VTISAQRQAPAGAHISRQIVRNLLRVAILMSALSVTVAAAQAPAAPPPAPAAAPDPQIAAALKQVSADRIRATIEKLVSFNNRNTTGSNHPELAAAGKGVVAAREWIKVEFERYSQACGGCLEVKTDSFIQPPGPRINQPTELTNVYAVLRGTDPQNAGRMYLVTGHYDSILISDFFDVNSPAPGANDDASGTAVSLECARVLSQHKFPATIIFLTVAGEEQGLDGSAHFAKMARDQQWDIEGALNNDIVGGNRSPDDPNQNSSLVRVFSEGIPATATPDEVKRIRALGAESDSPSRELARYIRETGETYAAALPDKFAPMLVFRPDRYLRGGDHTSFNQQGYAAVRFTEFREDFRHQHQPVRVENGQQYGDLLQFVDFNYVANVARLNAGILASLASAPAPPANVRLETKKLENTSTLSWAASPGGLATGYEVVWRETTSPFWERAVSAGNATSITLPQSKDNVIFAVRAVDRKGHRSLPVTPVPER